MSAPRADVRELLDFMKRLRERASEEADLPNADGDDRRILEGDEELLQSSMESLTEIIETRDELVAWTGEVLQAVQSGAEVEPIIAKLPNLKLVNGPVVLKSALWAAFSLGGYVLEEEDR